MWCIQKNDWIGVFVVFTCFLRMKSISRSKEYCWFEVTTVHRIWWFVGSFSPCKEWNAILELDTHCLSPTTISISLHSLQRFALFKQPFKSFPFYPSNERIHCWNTCFLCMKMMRKGSAQNRTDFPLPHYPRRTAFPASLLLPFSPHRTILYWFLLQVRALRNIYDRMLIVVLGFPCHFCKSRDGMVYWECCWRIPGERKAGVEQRWIVFPAAILADGVANSTFAMDRTFVNIVWTAFG